MKILFDEQERQGRISETTFDRIGIPKDTEAHGNEIDSIHHSSFISHQRAQTINIKLQTSLRENQLQDLNRKSLEKNMAIANKTTNYLKANHQCTEILKNKLK